MAGFGRKLASYVGLVDDARYDDDLRDEELTEEVYSDDGYEPSQLTSMPSSDPQEPMSASPHREQERPMVVDEPSIADINRILTVHPRNYNEARLIGEQYRDGVPVIMNLTEMDDSDAKRLVDFAAGLIFGLRGTIERVTSKVFLLCPHNVNVAPEDKARIAGEGFFNQS
ncbi:cell division protein SepF [uncultured Cutibacterium sp.]|uniref:cell division protein SepF n=1 Tax=uncultured Cutibacterium sp. TaxID=1912223 RepID=UPI002803DD34|nr:cell division protein SepF [uncultured Cutibacterium sp.]MDU1581180.1 cell division protein SepF [Cutibacterium granulosum]MDU1863530.1 cell division protein SepF [Propionibacterium sp.]MDU6339076.1 cell division protein SepF [Cutibacterium granulosum]